MWREVNWTIEPDIEAAYCDRCGQDYPDFEISVIGDRIEATATWGCYNGAQNSEMDWPEFLAYLDRLPAEFLSDRKRGLIEEAVAEELDR